MDPLNQPENGEADNPEENGSPEKDMNGEIGEENNGETAAVDLNDSHRRATNLDSRA